MNVLFTLYFESDLYFYGVDFIDFQALVDKIDSFNVKQLKRRKKLKKSRENITVWTKIQKFLVPLRSFVRAPTPAKLLNIFLSLKLKPKSKLTYF